MFWHSFNNMSAAPNITQRRRRGRDHLKSCKSGGTWKWSYKFTGKLVSLQLRWKEDFIPGKASNLSMEGSTAQVNSHFRPWDAFASNWTDPGLAFFQIREFSWIQTVRRSSLVCRADLKKVSRSLLPLAWWQRASEAGSGQIWFGFIIIHIYMKSSWKISC